MKAEAKAPPRISPARTAAFDVLLRVEQGSFADELLHSALLNALFPVDRALCTEIVMGVLRWRFTIDCDIAALSFTPFRKLDLEVLTALRMGVYQLRFLDRIPRHAAINESVELVKRGRKASATALVNAILRKLSREKPAKTGAVLAPDELARTLSHPAWLMKRWVEAYTTELAATIA
ncbi:MAG: transcription antitermination factor NusB, partial [Burkholderiales bacterium]